MNSLHVNQDITMRFVEGKMLVTNIYQDLVMTSMITFTAAFMNRLGMHEGTDGV